VYSLILARGLRLRSSRSLLQVVYHGAVIATLLESVVDKRLVLILPRSWKLFDHLKGRSLRDSENIVHAVLRVLHRVIRSLKIR